MGDYCGLSTQSISANGLTLEFLDQAGPRIVRLSYHGSRNLFAELPQIAIPTPYGNYRYLGGHRLWHAPEAMPRSYIPDEEGLTCHPLSDGIRLDGKLEAQTGIQKSIEVHIDPVLPHVTLIHHLTNLGLWPLKLAPWAITMFRLSGTAILPLRSLPADPAGLLPDSHIVFWPYCHYNDPRIQYGDGYLLVQAREGYPSLKIGTFDPCGWIAYWIDGLLFKKSFQVLIDGTYPDRQCNAEVYTDDQFIELEIVGKLTVVEPGRSIQFEEVWDVYDSLHQDYLPAEAVAFLQANG